MAAISFLGCSVLSFNSNLGLRGNQSTITVSALEDLRNGDFFLPPAVGQPCYLTFGLGFQFWGLLQGWRQSDSINGFNVFDINIIDPRDLLVATQLIIGNYNGPVLDSSGNRIPNILNCYGYLENGGVNPQFGDAQVNDSGMPWYLIYKAINDLMQGRAADLKYGGPISFRDYDYIVDLSNLPETPDDFRLAGPYLTLFDAIQQVCDNGGCDFFVTLDADGVITVNTISRYNQPPLGTIAAITQNNWGGTVVSSTNGLELRNEVTTSFIVGGQKNILYTTDNLQPFWGYVVNKDNNTIIPVDNNIVLIPQLGYCNAGYVDASEISDALYNKTSNPPLYFLTEFECRAAMHSQDMWLAYISYESSVLNSNKSLSIGPQGIAEQIFSTPQAIVIQDFMRNLKQGTDDLQESQQTMVYRFVKKIADNWYGRKYWVSLPFVSLYQDPNTLEVKSSHQVSEGGWLSDDEDLPLGLLEENTIKFLTEDRRFEAFAIYSPVGIELEQQSPNDTAWQENGFYTKIDVDRNMLVWPKDGLPVVAVTIPTPVTQQSQEIGEDVDALAVILQQANKNSWNIVQQQGAFGVADLIMKAPCYQPKSVAIPVQSNVDTYGPWYAEGAIGKVQLEQVPDLVPWNYGSEELMNAAALSKVTNAITFMQEAENGQIELVGLPLISLGDVLVAFGPQVTNMEVHYGKEGLRTNYIFNTFTDFRYNKYALSTQDSLKRMGRVQNELKKNSLIALNQLSLKNSEQFNSSIYVDTSKLPKWMQSHSPHPVFIASAIYDTNHNKIRVSTSIADTNEGWAQIGGLKNNNTLFVNSSLCSISAIVRPFYNNINPHNLAAPTYLPITQQPSGNLAITSDNLNPFNFPAYTDLECLSAGTSTKANGAGYIVQNNTLDWTNIRGMALAMPIMCCGWGFDIHGQTTPIDNSANYNVGPLDPLWDNYRKTWSVHDSIFGVLIDGVCPAGGTALMTIMGTDNLKLTVSNLYSKDIPNNTRICVNWQPYIGVWAIISADCPS